jgi:hypothetical protein
VQGAGCWVQGKIQQVSLAPFVWGTKKTFEFSVKKGGKIKDYTFITTAFRKMEVP